MDRLRLHCGLLDATEFGEYHLDQLVGPACPIGRSFGEAHPGWWRAVWAYSAKPTARDGKTLTLQENRAKEVIAGEKTARTPRFVKSSNGARSLDEASLARPVVWSD